MNSAPNQTLPNADKMVRAIGHSYRWRMLKELSGGEMRTIQELADAAGCYYDNALRHLKILKDAGLVVQPRGKLYQIPKQYLSTTGQPHVDFGHCLLRMDVAG